MDNSIYELPDKKNIVIGKEVYEIPEKLFKSSEFIGLEALIEKSIDQIDPELKRDILGSVIICGGTSNTKNFIERLQKEICDHSEWMYNYKSRFLFFNGKIERRCSSWIGASVLGSLDSFENLILTKSEYKEHGLSLLDRKFN